MRDRKDTQKTRGRDDDTSDSGIPLIYVVSHHQTSGIRKTAQGVRKKESPPADRGDSRDKERVPEAIVPSGQALPPQKPQEPQEPQKPQKPQEKPEKAAKQERPEKPGKKG